MEYNAEFSGPIYRKFPKHRLIRFNVREKWDLQGHTLTTGS